MSELVATSPRKLDLCSQDPLDARKRSPTRPKSLALPLTASSLPRLSTPQRAKRQSHIGSVASLAIELDASRKTDLASPLTMRSSRQYSPTRWGSDTSTEESAVTDEAEDTSVSSQVFDTPVLVLVRYVPRARENLQRAHIKTSAHFCLMQRRAALLMSAI